MVTIKSENGTYYRGMTAIGPMFGGTKEQATQFNTIQEAAMEMTRHSFAFIGCEVEEEVDFI